MRYSYHHLTDDQLFELLFTQEDRLEKEAALEMAGRDSLAPYLARLVMEKHSWLAELPEWWSVVHATYVLALRGGSESLVPLVACLRWSDAFDCDWVTELIPSIFGHLGPLAMERLTALALDPTLGWSGRDLALKSLAAITLGHPETQQEVFDLIGGRFMDEAEDPGVRQLAALILLDFRHPNYRMPLMAMARGQWAQPDWEAQWLGGLDPDEVEWAYRNGAPELWHYQEEWMRFYEPEEIQRRQKRWAKERLGSQRSGRVRTPPASGGVLLSLGRQRKGNEPPPPEDEGI